MFNLTRKISVQHSNWRRAFAAQPAANRRVSLQLDYYMSSQFAGIAVAQEKGLYASHGIDLHIQPTCEPGLEPYAVIEQHKAAEPGTVCIGTVEQNVLFPCVSSDGVEVSAISAIFGRSPLALAAMPNSKLTSAELVSNEGGGLTVGAHVDTVDLIKRLLPKATVIDVPRVRISSYVPSLSFSNIRFAMQDEKMGMLRSGELHLVQVYDVMETIMLEDELGEPPHIVPFNALNGSSSKPVNLGVGQLFFTPTTSLSDPENVTALRGFLAATFEGWQFAIADPRAAAKIVMPLQPTGIDHWIDSLDFTERSISRCCEYVKATSSGEKLGVISEEHWNTANEWLAHGDYSYWGKTGAVDSTSHPKLDSSIWTTDPRLMVGAPLARKILDGVRVKTNTLGRKPKLALITIGSEPEGGTHSDAVRRLQLFSPQDASWFDKKAAGAAVGIEVEEIVMPVETTTEELLAEIKRHQRKGGSDYKDGIQLMWPMPKSIDQLRVYTAIPHEQDVDGVHYIDRIESAGGQSAIRSGAADLLGDNAPVAPLAVIKLLDHYNVDVSGKNTVVVGRSRITGMPLSYMLAHSAGAVTLLHSESSPGQMKAACADADILIVCAGVPSLIDPTWVKRDAVVVSCGKTFVDDQFQSDVGSGVSGTDDLKILPQARLVASAPGGVGPLSLALLFDNLANNARRLSEAADELCATKPVGAVELTPALSPEVLASWLGERGNTWTTSHHDGRECDTLFRAFHFANYPMAIAFASELIEQAEKINHHPNLAIEHSCTQGVTVGVELFTFATGGISAFDLEVAEVADEIFG
jgi:5,10-methylene-tetrahydrofolate dehydrogenase/methenyl tetrahydrofolate cyclohydrolase/pterin-4a-carbinolamine dehydratase